MGLHLNLVVKVHFTHNCYDHSRVCVTEGGTVFKCLWQYVYEVSRQIGNTRGRYRTLLSEVRHIRTFAQIMFKFMGVFCVAQTTVLISLLSRDANLPAVGVPETDARCHDLALPRCWLGTGWVGAGCRVDLT